MACPLTLSPTNNLNKRVNRSGLATQSSPVTKTGVGTSKHSPSSSEESKLQMTVGTEVFPVNLDGQAAPFFPIQGNILAAPILSVQGGAVDNLTQESGIWTFLTALQNTLSHQQQELHALALKCQHLEYNNIALGQKVTMQESLISGLEQKTTAQEDKILGLEQALDDMKANPTHQKST
eukprot:c20825_g1_i1 orf=1-534(-)